MTFKANESTNGTDVTGVCTDILPESAFKENTYKDMYTLGVMDTGVNKLILKSYHFNSGINLICRCLSSHLKI